MLDNIEMKVRAIIKACLDNEFDMDFDIDKVGSEERIGNHGVNSILFVRIAISIETEFGFEFDDKVLDIDKLPSIKSIAQYIKTKV